MKEYFSKAKLSLLALVVSGGTLTTCVQCTSTDMRSVNVANNLSDRFQENVVTTPYTKDAELHQELDTEVYRQEMRGWVNRATTQVIKDTQSIIEEVDEFLSENEDASETYRQESANQISESFERYVRMEKGKDK